jgi:hypothetical protein
MSADLLDGPLCEHLSSLRFGVDFQTLSLGGSMVELVVVAADITKRPCDLLLLKHANGFHGVDRIVSKRLGFGAEVPEGEAAFVAGRNIGAREVLYIGVGPLGEFRYPQIRTFGRRALELAARGSGRTQILCTPLHGPGYGLDEREAFLSLVGGFLDGIERGAFPADLERVEIVELNPRRAERLNNILSEFIVPSSRSKDKRVPFQDTQTFSLAAASHEGLSSFGVQSERKTKLFVAMPFAPEHSDVWEIAIQESCQTAGIVCERVDEQAYTGDILTQIMSRLRNASGVLALLNDANPNVFLEIGFAWGTGKPTVLIAKKGISLPFDVLGQKCIQYTSIANLRSLLTAELTSLKSQGVFGS